MFFKSNRLWRCCEVYYSSVDGEVDGRLQLFSLWAERPVFDEPPLDGREWLDRLRGNETDAAFIIRRSAALPVRGMANDHLYDELGLTLRVAAGPTSPLSAR